MAVSDDLFSQLGNSGVKGLEGIQHHVHAFLEGVSFICFGNRCVNIVSAKLVDFQPAGFEVKEALEGRGIFFADIQQRIHRFVGHIVAQVANRDRGAVISQIDILVGPIPHYGLVDLSQDRAVISIDTVLFLINRLSKGGIMMAGIHHQFAPGQVFFFTSYIYLEGITVGDRVIQGDQGAEASHVFDIEDFFFRFRQCMGCVMAHFFQPVFQIAGGGH